MSLFGSLSVGESGLRSAQGGLGVIGNNIANAGTPGYTRQVTNFSPGPDQQVTPTQMSGSGVTIASITRQVNEALNENLRDATSDQNASNSLNSMLTQLQTTFGALNENDLSSQLSTFFNNFSTLAQNPTDSSLRAQMIQSGVTISQYLQSLRTQVGNIATNANGQIQTLTTQANTLLQQVASLNRQIASAGNSNVNSLYDQRDNSLTQLSQLMNITAVPQGNGMVNVMMGSIPVVDGTVTRGLSTKQTLDPTGQYSITQVTFADTGDPTTVNGGQIGGLVNARDNFIEPAIQTVDTVAAGLVSSVNSVYSQGQGLKGYSSVTGTTQVLDTTLPLNAGTTQTGITFPPANGTFTLYITDNVAGTVTPKQINVNLSGTGTQTSLDDIVSQINTAGGGVITASDTGGYLKITSGNKNVTFGFGQDSSGTLAALGVNTFFSGKDALTIAVNSTVQKNPDLLATGRYSDPNNPTPTSIDNQANAKALSTAGNAAVAILGGQGLTDYYTNYIGNLATQAQNVSNDLSANTTIQTTLTTQQQSISGVSMDEETVNMMQYQRAFEGSAKYINVINQMMQDVLGLIG
ncbi:MAG: flagellar hook-associated protein FlgK [Phycisphaerae bacterium]